MERVLVTDGHFRKTLAVVRSLGRRGVEVTVGERTFLNTSFFSKYCSQRILYPSPRRHPDQFIDFLLREIRKNSYDCLFPMEEETLLLIAKYQSEISQYTYLLTPDLQKIEFVRDKGNLIQFAETHGIPVPTTYCFPPTPEPYEVQGHASEPLKLQDVIPQSNMFQESPAPHVVHDLTHVPAQIPVPVVIKPRISSGSFGIVYVKKMEDLASSYQRVHQHYPLPQWLWHLAQHSGGGESLRPSVCALLVSRQFMGLLLKQQQLQS